MIFSSYLVLVPRGFRGKKSPRHVAQRYQRGPEALEDIYTLLRRDCVCERRDHGCAELPDDEDECGRIHPDLSQDGLFCPPQRTAEERNPRS
jgi:hypothetical protein